MTQALKQMGAEREEETAEDKSRVGSTERRKSEDKELRGESKYGIR